MSVSIVLKWTRGHQASTFHNYTPQVISYSITRLFFKISLDNRQRMKQDTSITWVVFGIKPLHWSHHYRILLLFRNSRIVFLIRDAQRQSQCNQRRLISQEEPWSTYIIFIFRILTELVWIQFQQSLYQYIRGKTNMNRSDILFHIF